MLFDAVLDALVDLIIDEDSGQAANLQQVAALWVALSQIIHLDLAHLAEVDRNPPRAGFRHDAVEGYNRNAGITRFLDGTIERRGGGGIDDDGVIALQDQILNLRRLLGRLI